MRGPTAPPSSTVDMLGDLIVRQVVMCRVVEGERTLSWDAEMRTDKGGGDICNFSSPSYDPWFSTIFPNVQQYCSASSSTFILRVAKLLCEQVLEGCLCSTPYVTHFFFSSVLPIGGTACCYIRVSLAQLRISGVFA